MKHPPTLWTRSRTAATPARRRGLAAGLVVSTTLTIAAVTTGPVAAEPSATAPRSAPPAGAPAPTSELAPGTYDVSLITGDRATLTVGADRRIQVTIEPASRPDGSSPSITWYSAGDGVYVVPEDVTPYLESGQLDEKLFDVEYLAANRYGTSGELPLIVEYAGAAKPLAATAATQPLKSVGAASVTVKQSRLHDFWAGLVKDKPKASGPVAKTSARTPAPATALPGGVERIWLDRAAKIVLDRSVPQIGAPQAWQAGYTGSGVKVAVLDTGIDAAHPDLAGRVVASRTFVGGTTAPTDGNGHGTHVASTVAGSGTASGGKYVGVAPDADLIIGKVCDDGGSCLNSDMIAGMEWAAIDQKADVISMSIGGCCSDGNDPLSLAVNALTEQTGALFVIAAGNDGPGAGTIGSPGAADAALTVGAVDRNDQMAGFSSRGPRPGNGALKPEIVAPGVEIVAARANAPANPYMSASGTSMATPHVSGAAALLAQQHPDWTAAQLKAALVASAHDAGHSVYEQGGGRVDIARATRQQVRVSPAVADFGSLDEPQDGPALTRVLTYTNPGDVPVTLSIAASLRNANGATLPEGTITVDADMVTVPAGSSASVTVSLNRSGLGAAMYTGSVVATDAATDLRLASPVGFTIGDQKHRLSITAVSRDCDKGVACVEDDTSFWFGTLLAFRVGDVPGQPATVGQPARQVTRIAPRPTEVPGEVRTYEAYLPAGEYLLVWSPRWQDPVTNRHQHAQMIAPEVYLSGPTEVRLDANTAVRTTFETPQPISENISARRMVTRLMPDGSVGESLGAVYAYGAGEMWSNPIDPVRDGTLQYSFGGIFTAPEVTMTVGGTTPFALKPIYSGYYPDGHDHWTVPVRFPAGTRTLGLVNVGRGTEAELARVDVSGKLVLLHNDLNCHVPNGTLQRLLDAGAVGVLFDPKLCHVPVYLYPLVPNPEKPRIPYVSIPGVEAERLAELLDAGPVSVTVTSTPVSPYTYYLNTFDRGRLPAEPHYRFDSRNLFTVDARYHSGREAFVDSEYFSWHAGERMQIAQNYVFPVPGTMTEYWSVDPTAEVWRFVTGADLNGAFLSRKDVFAKPGRRVEHWNSDPMVPGAAVRPTAWTTVCSGCRDGDTFWPQMYLTNDDPAFVSNTFGLNAPVSAGADPWQGLHLYRDGTEIPITPFYGFYPSYSLPPDAGRYQLVLDTDIVRSPSRTVWDFVSAGTADTDTAPGDHICMPELAPGGSAKGCRAEPLIYLRYSGLGLNLRNEAKVSGTHRFEVTAYRQPSATAPPAIAGLKLWVSYDGGTQWTRATVTAQRDGTYSVSVRHPSAKHRASNTVAIRAEAWDSEGNRVQQTITNAYRIADRHGVGHRGDLPE